MNRRDFMKSSVVAIGGAMLARAATPPNAFAVLKEARMEYITLNNGVKMPILGYGTLHLPAAECAKCVSLWLSTSAGG